MIQAILFDLDGTLVEAKEWHYKALNMALWEVAKTRITRHEHITQLDGLPTRKKLMWLLERKRITPEHIDAIQDLKQKFTLKTIETHCVPDQIKVRMCEELHLKYLLACVSNAVYKSVYLMLRESDLLPYFDLIQSNENVKPKPDPDPYLKTLDALNLKAEECIAVEDHPRGVQSAEAAGIHCLHLQYPEITLEQIQEELCKLTS